MLYVNDWNLPLRRVKCLHFARIVVQLKRLFGAELSLKYSMAILGFMNIRMNQEESLPLILWKEMLQENLQSTKYTKSVSERVKTRKHSPRYYYVIVSHSSEILYS